MKKDPDIIFPKIHLAIDNVFASKRWTEPEEWMKVSRDCGIRYIEASADTECDPLYGGKEYLRDWLEKVKRAEERSGMKVVNLYSGHGTYATLGLSHTDPRVGNRIQEEWLKPMIRTAAELDAGLGFYCHAFSDSVLQDPDRYKKTLEDLFDRLGALGHFASTLMTRPLAVEQMYSPHQVPWTIAGTKELLREVYHRGNHPFYITIDVGHQSGQQKFLKPEAQRIKEEAENCSKTGKEPGIWLGPESAYREFEELVASGASSPEKISRIILLQDSYPHLFAERTDTDPYNWLSQLGRWSPIVHLQQTDGQSSRHLPFTPEANKNGIIHPLRVLESLDRAFRVQQTGGMPPVPDHIYLTLELFAATPDINRDLLARIRESITYWRKFIPEDGISLDQITHNLKLS